MQWNKTPCAYLDLVSRSVQNQEQTVEIRLPEGLPDAVRVLGTWGQPVVRSKQWRSDGMVVSGGIAGWVLYCAEEGPPQCVECWLPFTAKWSLPETKREGSIRTACCLKSMDARLLSARKLMARATVSVLAEAFEPKQAQLCSCQEACGDIQLLENTYILALCRQAGEKLFTMDEMLELPKDVQQILAWRMEPQVTEQTVLADKALFKGVGNLHLVYCCEDERIASLDLQVPFAQYAQLDADYDKEATVTSMAAVSSLEPELEDGQLHLKAGLVLQYLVQDPTVVSLAEDAYSPLRQVEVQTEALSLPVTLDCLCKSVTASKHMEQSVARAVDCVFLPDHPVCYREEDMAVLELPGYFQVTGFDEAGQLMTCTENWIGRVELPVSQHCEVLAQITGCGPVSMTQQGGSLLLEATMQLQLQTRCRQELPMVTQVQLGQELSLDPERPAVILRRCDDRSLWELAKSCGSTVDAIRSANGLQFDPEPGQMLLIPVC